MSASAPLLRADLAIVEQIYRKEQSFVVKDPRTQAYFRFRPVEVRVMRMFDGVRSAAEVAEALMADGVRVSAATVAGFVRQLTKLGLLETTLRERSTQQLERLRNERRRKGSLIRGELLRMRFTFGDPNRRLGALHPYLRWCFTRAFVVTSIALFAIYLAIVGTQRRAFSEALAASFSPGALTPWTIAVLVLTFALLTLIHELGHAVACKHFGGEVHEMGFMLLLFMPAFYANVNDAWSFAGRRERLWVTFAGPWIELTVTAVLAIVWLIVPPDTVVAELAVAAMLIGGVGNILTNLNPLLPLDGYFALGDWLEVSNLRHRAKAAAAGWFRRRFLRADEAAPALDPRERRLLLGYGALSGLYSTGFLLLIAWRLIGAAERTLGVLVAGLLLLALLFMLRSRLTALAGAARVATRARLARGGRRRRWLARLGVAAALLALGAVIPCHLTTSGAFTVEPAGLLAVTAPASGVVADVFVREGDVMTPGAPVLRVADYALAHDVATGTRAADSLAFDAGRAWAGARAAEGDILADEARSAAASTAAARVRMASMQVRAGASGTVATPRPERLVGRPVEFGDTLVVLGDLTTLEAVIRLTGSGATDVRPGQTVRLLSSANGAHALTGVVDAVSLAAGGAALLEARVRLPRDAGLPPGATGQGRVVRGRTSVLGAIVAAVRTWVRSDLLL